MKIRAEQMETFEEAALRSFENRMVAHLQNFAPNHSKILTEDEMRVVIRHGMKQAECHQFTSERSLRIYIELMLMLGSSFDTDPQLAWAAELLNDETIKGEVERIDRLQQKAWDYVEQVLPDFGGAEGEASAKSFIEQIRQLRHTRNENLIQSEVPEFYQRVIAQLKQTLPRKCELLSEQGLRRLINRGMGLASSYNITTERGYAFFVAAMFMLGSGFDKDPQLPWAERVLQDLSITDQNERVDLLFAGAIDCLKRMRQ